MREIKFRCWDKKYKSFELRGIGTTFPHDVYSGNGKIHQTLTITRPDSDLVWQQYTGLKDKNGVEIYEGDIVTVPYIPNPDEERRYSVEWDNYDAHFLLMPHGHSMRDGSMLEIIGNIYENPELYEH